MVADNNQKTRTGKAKKSGKKKKLNSFTFTLLIIVAAILLFFVGSAIGYSIVGEKPLNEIFDLGTWSHMYDLIFG